MNRFISGLADARRRVFPNVIRGRTIALWVLKAAAMLSIVFLPFYACKREAQEQTGSLTLKRSGKTSAQPLLGGKARFTWVVGHFATSGNQWERMVNLTFDGNAGTVAATVWLWQSQIKAGKTAFNSHTCTFDGVTKTCSTYTPTGWLAPAGQYTSWGGTYTYNTTTKILTINWTTGNPGGSDNWQISNPASTIARATFISNSYAGTHGRGYGSNASWSTYKTITQMIPFPNYTWGNGSKIVSVVRSTSGGTATITMSPTTPGAWANSGLNLSNFTTPSSPSPPNTMHYWDTSATSCVASMCNPNQRPGVSGIIYHLTGTNTGRGMAYQHFCACLATASSFPCYTGNNHPSAFSQIIDDNGSLAGFVGLQAQNPSGAQYNGDYMFSLMDFNNIP